MFVGKDGRRHVSVYDPAASRNWKACAQEHLGAAMRDAQRAGVPFDGPLAVTIVARFTCPISQHRKREPRPERPHVSRPDLDNVCKAVLDAGTGVVWLRDEQVFSLHAVKLIAAQGAPPGVEVMVMERLP